MHQDQPPTAAAANAKACSRSKLQKKLPAPCTNTQMRGLSGASRHSRQPTAPERDDRNRILRFYFRPTWRRSGEDQEHGKSARICSSNISNTSSIYKQRLRLHQRVQQRLLEPALWLAAALACNSACVPWHLLLLAALLAAVRFRQQQCSSTQKQQQPLQLTAEACTSSSSSRIIDYFQTLAGDELVWAKDTLGQKMPNRKRPESVWRTKCSDRISHRTNMVILPY